MIRVALLICSCVGTTGTFVDKKVFKKLFKPIGSSKLYVMGENCVLLVLVLLFVFKNEFNKELSLVLLVRLLLRLLLVLLVLVLF